MSEFWGSVSCLDSLSDTTSRTSNGFDDRSAPFYMPLNKSFDRICTPSRANPAVSHIWVSHKPWLQMCLSIKSNLSISIMYVQDLTY